MNITFGESSQFYFILVRNCKEASISAQHCPASHHVLYRTSSLVVIKTFIARILSNKTNILVVHSNLICISKKINSVKEKVVK